MYALRYSNTTRNLLNLAIIHSIHLTIEKEKILVILQCEPSLQPHNALPQRLRWRSATVIIVGSKTN